MVSSYKLHWFGAFITMASLNGCRDFGAPEHSETCASCGTTGATSSLQSGGSPSSPDGSGTGIGEGTSSNNDITGGTGNASGGVGSISTSSSASAGGSGAIGGTATGGTLDGFTSGGVATGGVATGGLTGTATSGGAETGGAMGSVTAGGVAAGGVATGGVTPSASSGGVATGGLPTSGVTASATAGGVATGDATGGSEAGVGGSGSTGAGAAAGGTNASASDACSDADPGNDDRDHATSYVLGADYTACLQSASDVDYYEFTTPAAPAAGGVLMVSITNVGTVGNVDSSIYTTSNNGEVQSNYAASNGGLVFYWINAAAATQYQITVQHHYSTPTVTPYTLKAALTAVNDTNEPNDLRTEATAITVGTAIHGYLYAGYSVSNGFAANAWHDWFNVSLGAGDVTIALTDLASDINGEIDLYDSLGSMVTSDHTATRGASIVLTRTDVTAGDYYIKATPYQIPATRGTGSVTPQYTTQPYTLTVTQP